MKLLSLILLITNSLTVIIPNSSSNRTTIMEASSKVALSLDEINRLKGITNAAGGKTVTQGSSASTSSNAATKATAGNTASSSNVMKNNSMVNTSSANKGANREKTKSQPAQASTSKNSQQAPVPTPSKNNQQKISVQGSDQMDKAFDDILNNDDNQNQEDHGDDDGRNQDQDQTERIDEDQLIDGDDEHQVTDQQKGLKIRVHTKGKIQLDFSKKNFGGGVQVLVNNKFTQAKVRVGKEGQDIEDILSESEGEAEGEGEDNMDDSDDAGEFEVEKGRYDRAYQDEEEQDYFKDYRLRDADVGSSNPNSQ